MMIALSLYLQMVFEYNALEAGLSIAPLSLGMFVVALLAGKRAGKRRPSVVIRLGFALLSVGTLILIPLIPRVDAGWQIALPLLLAGSGLGLLVSQLNNFTLSPISAERVSEAAGVNSAAGSFGLSFGLAFAGAVMLAMLSLVGNQLTQSSSVLTGNQKQQVAQALEHDAEIMSDSQLTEQLNGQPAAVRQEIVRINDEARHIALQTALLVPLLAGIIGLGASFKMVRLPDPAPATHAEAALI